MDLSYVEDALINNLSTTFY